MRNVCSRLLPCHKRLASFYKQRALSPSNTWKWKFSPEDAFVVWHRNFLNSRSRLGKIYPPVTRSRKCKTCVLEMSDRHPYSNLRWSLSAVCTATPAPDQQDPTNGALQPYDIYTNETSCRWETRFTGFPEVPLYVQVHGWIQYKRISTNTTRLGHMISLVVCLEIASKLCPFTPLKRDSRPQTLPLGFLSLFWPKKTSSYEE